MENRSQTKVNEKSGGSTIDMSRPSQAEVSPAAPSPADPSSLLFIAANSEKMIKSAVRFEDAKQELAKDNLKKQKQAWDSPLDTSIGIRTPLSPIRHQPGSKKVLYIKCMTFKYIKMVTDTRLFVS